MLTFEGLASGQVLQRAFPGCPAAVAYVAADRSGELWIRVTSADGLLEGFERRVLRRIETGRHACELPDLPPGGPYDLAFGIDHSPACGDDTVVVRDVLVGDVWAADIPRDEIELYVEEQRRGDAFLWAMLDGFFWFPRRVLGIERHLLAFYDQPELMHRINEDLLAHHLKVLNRFCDI